MVNAATERMAHDPAVAGRVRDTLSAMEDALTRRSSPRRTPARQLASGARETSRVSWC
jgi:hypothetical protein